jgi:hypothetical protein
MLELAVMLVILALLATVAIRAAVRYFGGAVSNDPMRNPRLGVTLLDVPRPEAEWYTPVGDAIPGAVPRRDSPASDLAAPAQDPHDQGSRGP